MFGMVASLLQGSSKLEEKIESVAKKTEEHDTRIEALEKKVGEMEECAIPLSIVMQNVKKYASHPDIVVARKVIEEIKAEGVNPETDVVKAVRKGYKPATASQPERLGTIMVELRNEEVRAKIMKTKKVLEKAEGDVSNVKIKNMKSQAEVKQDFFNRQLLKMIPGGEQFYIAGNGSLRPQTRPSLRPSAPPRPLLPAGPSLQTLCPPRLRFPAGRPGQPGTPAPPGTLAPPGTPAPPGNPGPRWIPCRPCLHDPPWPHCPRAPHGQSSPHAWPPSCRPWHVPAACPQPRPPQPEAGLHEPGQLLGVRAGQPAGQQNS